jgi:hypothetical protein
LVFGRRRTSFRLINFFTFDSSIVVELHSLELREAFHVDNIYELYDNKIDFWEGWLTNYLFRRENVIPSGDLKFTTNMVDIWGSTARVDPSENFSLNKVDKILVDLDPIKLVPT